MNSSINIKILAMALFSGFLFGCSDDFIEVPPQSSLVDANFYKSDDQVLAATATLYNLVWFDYNDKASYNLGDFRGGSAFSAWGDRDNVEFNTTANTSNNGEAWRAFYNTVGQANSTMVNINTYAGEDVTEEIRNMAIGECRFMRGLAYRYLVMNWGAVPIIENNIALLAEPLSVRRNTVETVWQFITKDFRAAVELLPDSEEEEGRITKWAAEAMLARIYLTRSGVEASGANRKQEFLDSAMYYAQRVIELSGASLLENYAELYEYPYDNNSESLFSLQWTFTSGNTSYGTQNSMIAQITPTPELGNGDGWGGDKGATYWMLSLYEGFDMIDESTLVGHTNDERLHASFMLPGAFYPELSYKEGDEILTGYTVPFTDGIPGDAFNYAFMKKYVPGRLSATEASSQNYSLDTYMMRLAEVYLIYAEAALGNNSSTSDATALLYFNEVHNRAVKSSVLGPLTFMDIFEERMKEFALESVAWYDLVRLHYYNPELAYNIIGSQDRGLFFMVPNDPDDPTDWTIQKTAWDGNRYHTANSGNFRLPLPSAEVSAAPNLLEEPVPYDFGQ